MRQANVGWLLRNQQSILVYPPKGGANELSRLGPLEGLSNLYCIGERKLGFQKHERKSAFFESPKTFIFRVGGWWMAIKGVHRLCSNFGITTSKLIPNLASKVIYGYLIKIYE